MVVWRRRWAKLKVLVEALVRSIAAYRLVKMQPRSKLAAVLGKSVALQSVEVDRDAPLQFKYKDMSDIVWAHQLLERLTRNKLSCLMRSISARAMLEAKGIPTVLVLGVLRGEASPSDKFGAHAWIDVGGRTILGAREKEGHFAVAAFVLAPRVDPTHGARQ